MFNALIFCRAKIEKVEIFLPSHALIFVVNKNNNPYFWKLFFKIELNAVDAELDNFDDLKSNVSIPLSDDDKDDLDDLNSSKKNILKSAIVEEEEEPLSWFEWIYIFSVESLSTADLITDIFILIILIREGHQWWTTFSLIFMISPYLVSYTAMGTMMQKKVIN